MDASSRRKRKKQRQKERRKQVILEGGGKAVDDVDEEAEGSEDEESKATPASRAATLNARGFDEEELGFTDEDLTTTLRVIASLGKNVGAFRSQPFKELRGALHPLIEEQMKNYDVRGTLKRKRKDMSEIQSLKEQDKEWINRAALRAKRLAALEELNNAAPAIENGEGPVKMLTHMGEVDEAVTALRLHKVADGTVELDKEEEEVARTESRKLNIPINCYTCKRPFVDLHFFYDQLCPGCAELNYRKRNEIVDMTGRVALVTGARVKIGYRCALKLLRCGCTVLATSRFASDCARRFAQEQDFSKWSARLHCYGIDFRDLVSVENFCKFVTARFSRLDIIINNACQTIRRPVQYYAHLLEAERQPLAKKTEEERKLLLANEEFVVESGGGRGARRKALEVDEADCVRIEEVEEEEEEAERKSEHEEEEEEKKRACTRGAGKEKEKKKKEGKETEEEDEGRVLEKGMEGEAGSGGAAELSQMVVIEEDKDRDVRKFPQREGGAAVLDVNEQQLDLRGHNSWMLKLNQVSTGELAEVMAINAIAPAVINARLKPLLEASPEPWTFVVNVSAMEGKFYRYKTDQHPHTNMAKAALNMMTRTSAQDYIKSGIYMTAVDTGWINDEKPMELAARHGEQHNFQTPLDEVDAAARVLDPVIAPLVAKERGEEVEPHSGVFLKDFFKCEW